MKLSLTSFVLIAFITTSCVSNNNLNIQQSDKNTNLINGLNNEIATDDKLELEIGDLIFSIITLSNSLEVNIENALDRSLKKYNKRLANGHLGSKEA